MQPKKLFKTFIVLSLICLLFPVSSEPSNLNEAKEDIAKLRFDDAEKKLTDIARNSSDETRQEVLYLLAGLKRSGPEAELIYQEVIDISSRSSWSKKALLEIAKIRYALGEYQDALRIIEDSYVCDDSDEACLFYGLSAIMLERYEDAKNPLSRIKRGKLRAWAYLSLAEIEMATDNRDEACKRYQAMANTMINPTAIFRYAECLEGLGHTEQAKNEFYELVKNFKNTPEAILAAEKLQLMEKVKYSEQKDTASDEAFHGELQFVEGFTIQFGSFHDRYNAIKLAAKLKRLFAGVRIDSDLVDSKETHRVRLGYFRTREEAQSRATALSRETDEKIVIMKLP
jgi:tetratricopeptide (TPR) repeat protein